MKRITRAIKSIVCGTSDQYLLCFVRYTGMKSISAIHPAITENILVKCAPHISICEGNSVSISAMANSFNNIISKELHEKCLIDLYVLYWSHFVSTAIRHQPYRVVKERMGDQRGTKVAPWCKYCSSCGWWKSTSQDEVTLISEEVKSLALAVLELCLSEGISKSVRRKMR